MRTLLLSVFLAAALACAQQPEHSAPPAPAAEAQHPQQGDGQVPHGGAEVVHPGGPNESGTHTEAVVEHGEGHAEAPMPNEIWWKWANFAILAGGLGWLIAKNAGPFFRSRTEAIQQGISEATRTREEAEARAAEIERRVANLAVEVDQLRQQSREEIGREGERVSAETEAQIRKIQAQSEAEIASAAKHATQELKAYSARLALDLAERQLRGRLTPQNQDRLASSFVEELKTKAVTK